MTEQPLQNTARTSDSVFSSGLGIQALVSSGCKPPPQPKPKKQTNPHRMQTCIEFSVCVLGLFSCGFNALSPKPTNLKSKDLENVTEVLAVCYFGFGVPNAVETWAF